MSAFLSLKVLPLTSAVELIVIRGWKGVRADLRHYEFRDFLNLLTAPAYSNRTMAHMEVVSESRRMRAQVIHNPALILT